jgi:Polysaccharide lyase
VNVTVRGRRRALTLGVLAVASTLTIVGLAVAVVAADRGGDSTTKIHQRQAEHLGGPMSLLWRATMETGNLSEWTRGGSGGQYDTGSGSTRVSSLRAHTGRYSMALSIEHANGATGDQATRDFRWGLRRSRSLPQAAFYSAWFYFPRVWKPAEFWNIFQWKTKVDSGAVLPALSLNVGCCRSGRMFLYLWDSIARIKLGTSPVILPTRRWVQLEAFMRASTRPAGVLTVWQDRRKIITAHDVRTQLPSHRADARQWSLDSYTNGISPPDATIFVDDAAIARGSIR